MGPSSSCICRSEGNVADILVVEDERDLREVLVELLETYGYPCAQAENGEAALAWLRANPLPKLILLDAMMPRMDGVAFRHAQLSDPTLRGIRTFLVTAASDAETLAGELGTGLIRKPIDLDSLLDVVGDIIKEWATAS